jgi:hypothetical protein
MAYNVKPGWSFVLFLAPNSEQRYLSVYCLPTQNQQQHHYIIVQCLEWVYPESRFRVSLEWKLICSASNCCLITSFHTRLVINARAAGLVPSTKLLELREELSSCFRWRIELDFVEEGLQIEHNSAEFHWIIELNETSGQIPSVWMIPKTRNQSRRKFNQR